MHKQHTIPIRVLNPFAVTVPIDFSGSSMVPYESMMNAGQKILRWAEALLWMGFIYLGSTNLLSSSRTLRFLEPFLRWWQPDISWATIRHIHHLIRKGGHVAEYAILAVLFLRVLELYAPLARQWLCFSLALILSVAYATFDEYHQSFFSTRTGSPWDVLIDFAGAAIGLSLVWCFRRWWAKR